jgi:hypothetical protein
MIIRNTITEVAYNVQATVDVKRCLPVDFLVTNPNDSKSIGNMVRRAKSIVGNSTFSVLFDKVYYTGTELEIAQKLGITTLVAIPAPPAEAPAPITTWSTLSKLGPIMPTPVPKATGSPLTGMSTPKT